MAILPNCRNHPSSGLVTIAMFSVNNDIRLLPFLLTPHSGLSDWDIRRSTSYEQPLAFDAWCASSKDEIRITRGPYQWCGLNLIHGPAEGSTPYKKWRMQRIINEHKGRMGGREDGSMEGKWVPLRLCVIEMKGLRSAWRVLLVLKEQCIQKGSSGMRGTKREKKSVARWSIVPELQPPCFAFAAREKLTYCDRYLLPDCRKKASNSKYSKGRKNAFTEFFAWHQWSPSIYPFFPPPSPSQGTSLFLHNTQSTPGFPCVLWAMRAQTPPLLTNIRLEIKLAGKKAIVRETREAKEKGMGRRETVCLREYGTIEHCTNESQERNGVSNWAIRK